MGKVCKLCEVERPTTEFHRNSRQPDGLQPHCKPCRKEHRNKPIPKRAAKCAKCDSEFVGPRNQKYCSNKCATYVDNRDYDVEYEGVRDCTTCGTVKHVTDFHADRSKTQGRSVSCKDCVKSRYALYYQKRRDVYAQHSRTRRARVNQALSDGYIATLNEVVDFYGSACLFPGCEQQVATLDHVVPLIAGGKHEVSNFQPLCGSHNSSKGRKTIDYRNGLVWMDRVLTKGGAYGR